MKSAAVDAYIAGFPKKVQDILRKVRRAIRHAAPGAEEIISYRMPAYRQRGILVYFAGFKGHVGLYPPVRGHAALEKAVSKYAGPKGNLRFPYDQPVPFTLISRVVRFRVAQLRKKAAAK